MTRISETEAGFSLLNQAHSTMSTFEIDSHLPRLPLPSLAQTLDKYLRSTRPFLTDLEFLATEKKVENFRNGVGKALQFHLKAKANKEKNWLEKWWLNWAYLEWREPLLPYLNTAGLNIDSNMTYWSLSKHGIDVQSARASVIAYAYIKLFEELRNETLPVQKSRSSYLSMSQFRRFFNTCRIPGNPIDQLVCYFKPAQEGNCPIHFLVMFKNRFFKLEAYDRERRSLEIAQLYDQFSSIVNEYCTQSDAAGIGALTADRRENWAQNREYLKKLSPKNAQNLISIQESLLVINLDENECSSHDELAQLVFLSNSKNRFFDKSYQIVISKNGLIGCNIEHSPFDGSVSSTAAIFADQVEKMLKIEPILFHSAQTGRGLMKPIELEFDLDAKIGKEIESSVGLFENLCNQIEIKVLILSDYTKEKLKSLRVNPDTIVQMCLQLAFYQLYNKPAPTYETATTRKFYNGRTETVRSCSQEALEWCREMCRIEKKKNLQELFKKACDKHEKLMSEARENLGCDRHLLGLMLISKELNLNLHEIFTDEAWRKSGGGGNFLISSSCVGFLNTVPICSPFCLNGYSSLYSIGTTGVNIGLARFRQSTETDLKKFSESIESAFNQVEGLLASRSKL